MRNWLEKIEQLAYYFEIGIID